MTALFSAAANTALETLDLNELLARHSPRNLLVWLKLRIGEEIISENLAFFARPKHIGLRDPQITIQLDQGTGDMYELTLSAEQPALWVWLEMEDDAVRC